jgi:hypothetical protein
MSRKANRFKKANRRDGPGNFHLKPNGVFFIDGEKGGVMETEAFLASGLEPRYASQSGPMLVIDGEIHPKFSEDGTSFQRRNGVGSPDPHTLVFAISEGPSSISTASRGCSAITSAAPMPCSSTGRSRAFMRRNSPAATVLFAGTHRGAGEGALKHPI